MTISFGTEKVCREMLVGKAPGGRESTRPAEIRKERSFGERLFSHIVCLSIEAYKRALARVEILRSGYRGREEGEGATENFEAGIFTDSQCEIFEFKLCVHIPLVVSRPEFGSKLCCGSVEDGVALI